MGAGDAVSSDLGAYIIHGFTTSPGRGEFASKA
jgi:hypothetical protein